ncbi:hypothetical protein ACW95P_04890 [Candidatus Mycoplasma pogonae]
MIKKYKNLKKGFLFVLATTPLIVSAISVSAYDEKRRDETKMQWIDRNFSSLTEGQKDYFDWVPEYIRPSRFPDLGSWINQINLDMLDLRLNDTNFSKAVNNSDDEYHDHFFKADESLKEKFRQQARKINSMLNDKDDPNFKLTDLGQLQAIKGEFFQSWNNLNGFTKKLSDLIDSKSNFSSTQKSTLKTMMGNQLARLRNDDSDQQNNITESFLEKEKDYEKIISSLESLNSKIEDYLSKKTNKKYTAASSEKKLAFDKALNDAKSVDLSSRRLKSADLINLENKIIETYNALNGSEEYETIINSEKNKIRNYNSLSTNAQDEFIKQLDDAFEKLINSSLNTTDISEFRSSVNQTAQKSKNLNDSFANLESAFAKYKNTIKTPKHDDATNKNEEDQKVITAINSVLDSPKLTELNEASSISNGKFSYIDSSKVTEAINAINDAFNSLNGDLNKRKEQSREKLSHSPLTELSEKTLEEINKQINNATTIDALDALDTKANNVATSFKSLKDKYNELKPVLDSTNYKLSNTKEHNEFLTSFQALEAEKNKNENILDIPTSTFLNLVDAVEAAKIALNGDVNLTTAKDKIDALTNLSSDQKTQAKIKMGNLSKVSSITDLNNLETLFTDIDSKIGVAKRSINGTDSLTDDEKNNFINKLGQINISDLTETQAQNKINEVVWKAKKTAWYNKALKDIGTLTHLSATLIQKVKDKLNSFDKTDAGETEAAFKTKLDNLVSKTEALNSKYNSEIVAKFNDYVATIGTTKYDEANNKDTQNAAVYAALNEIVSPAVSKPTILTNSTNINTLKIGLGSDTLSEVETLLDNLSAKATEVAGKIEAAKNGLNGETVLATKITDKKRELEQKINSTTEFNELPDDVKNSIKKEITDTTSLSDLDDIEARIDAAKPLITSIRERIDQLKAKQNEANYLLSNPVPNQSDYDSIITKLEKHLKQNLFDNTKKNAAQTDLDNLDLATAQASLNGDDNLTTAVTNLSSLSDLSDDQKIQAGKKLNNLATVNTKAKLDATATSLSDINAKLKKAKEDISVLSHLTQASKNKLIEELGKIDITDIDLTTAETEINKIVTKATDLNTSLDNELTKLKTVLKKYTDEINNPKHDVTQNVNNIDQDVLNELKKVLGNVTDTTLTNGFNINSKKLSTDNITAIQQASANINAAFAKLNGDQEITKITNKLNEAPWSGLNDATKNSIRTAAIAATSYSQLQDVITKADQVVTDANKINQKITDIKNVKTKANYKLSETSQINDFDNQLSALETKFSNDDIYNKTAAEIDAILEPINVSNAALTGDVNKNNALNIINSFTNIPESTQRNTIKSKINNLAETNTKAKLDAIVDKFRSINTKIGDLNSQITNNLNHLSPELKDEFKIKVANINIDDEQSVIEAAIQNNFNNAEAINDKFNKLKIAVINYKAAFTKQEYTEATSENKTAQNQKVKEALESVLKDKTYTNIETELQALTSETLKAGTTLASVEAAITKINDALSQLNGLTQVNQDKEKVREKVENTDTSIGIYNTLNDDTKNAILADLDNSETNTKAKVTEIDTKASQALDAYNALLAKIEELENYQVDKDYKLASQSGKDAYDKALAKLKEQLTKNLYNNTIRAETEAAITTASRVKSNLEGNENLDNAKTEIAKLTNLLPSTITDIQNDLENLAKYSDKSALDDAVAKFREVNTKLGEAETNINALDSLSHNAKEAFVQETKVIDINANKTDILDKIVAVETKATDLHNKYDELKTAYDAYKTAMSTADYVDATPTVKTNQDENVKAATRSVLEVETTPSVTQDLEGGIKEGVMLTDVKAAIAKIKKALTDLDGNENLARVKQEVQEKTAANGEFGVFNDATKTAINQGVTDANFVPEVDIIDDKATKALETLKEIQDTIQKLEEAQQTTNYTLADDSRRQDLDAVLQKAKNLNNTNLLADDAKTNLSRIKSEAESAINNLNGNENLKDAQDKMDTFTNIPQPERNDAKNNLPTTSLPDLKQKVNDLEEINNNIGKNQNTIQNLPNLSQDTKDKFKEDVAKVDWSKSKDENIKDSDDITATAVALNEKFTNFQLDLDNYLTIRETPTYTASTNGVKQNKKVVDAINKILLAPVNDPYDVTDANTFKHGISVADIDDVFKEIQDAINALDGNEEVEKAKTKLFDLIANGEKYKSLSHNTKHSLQESINLVTPNQHDWSQKLNDIAKLADKALEKSNAIDVEIEKAEEKGNTESIVGLKEVKEGDLTVTTNKPVSENSNLNLIPQSKKPWWLLSLFAFVPVLIWRFLAAKRKKIKK